MNILLSLNSKFFIENGHYFINKIKEHDINNSVDGFEISFDFEDEVHVKFVEDIISYTGYQIQFHGSSALNLDKQYQYLNYINAIASKINRKINIVMHPINKEDMESSSSATNKYYSDILNYIYLNNLNLNISIENLTSRDKNFLSKEFLLPVIANNIDLNYTYDIGHEIFEYGEITNLHEVLIERLSNVHLHTFLNNFDHIPITQATANKEKWLKSILYLKKLNYSGPIVLEYDFDLFGDIYDEQIASYIKSADFIKDYIDR